MVQKIPNDGDVQGNGASPSSNVPPQVTSPPVTRQSFFRKNKVVLILVVITIVIAIGSLVVSGHSPV